MNDRLLVAMLVTLAAVPGPAAAAAAQPRPAAATSPRAAAPTENPRTDLLPDEAVVARVENRTITAFNFRERYFGSKSEFLPRADSAGRVEFLNSLIDKEVLGLTALATDRPLGYEDRLSLRRHTTTVLQNSLYDRQVSDSIVVTDEELARAASHFSRELRLRGLMFDDRATAERVRADLLRGRITWAQAARRQSRPVPGNPQGDMGWMQRAKVRGELGIKAFALKPGGISEVIREGSGYRLVQCVESREGMYVPVAYARLIANDDLRSMKRAPLAERFYRRVREFAQVSYDTANIRWTIEQIAREGHAGHDHAAGDHDESDHVGSLASFDPADTGRVLARTPRRAITLGQFTSGYSAVPLLARGELVTVEDFIAAFDGPSLEPERLEMAQALGIDRHPITLAEIERQREELLVEHLYQDSVLNRVHVTPDQRRSYYRENLSQMVRPPLVTYARFLRADERHADRLLARLAAGEPVHRILEADSLAGDDSTGSIHPDVHAEAAGDLRALLFEELRPGQAQKIGPDRNGRFLVIQLLRYEPERQLAYEEVQNVIDESLQNLQADRLLRELIARRRRAYRIESHPEWVMRIDLRDPQNDVVWRAQRQP